MNTILVVDDSAICREPMAAMLRLAGYETLEAANGEEALQIAQEKMPDLIIMDISMPVMDGLTCLARLRTLPDAVHMPVVMLTSSSERKTVVQAAHLGISKFLLKTNFSSAGLLACVEALIGGPGDRSAGPLTSPGTTPGPRPGLVTEPSSPPEAAQQSSLCHPDERLSAATVLERLNSEIELRTVKPVLQYVISMTQSGESTLDEIASAVRQDQALAVQILRLANSSFYQRGRKATNLKEAAQLIGLTAVRNVVFTILAIEHFGKVSQSGLVPQRFWEHSLATAVLAELLGEKVGHQQPEQLFLAGLLHDVGRFVLSAIFPDEYARVFDRAQAQEESLDALESEVFWLSHADATRLLLGHWKMPTAVVEAASHHESSIARIRKLKPDSQSALLVALANRLAHALIAGNSGDSRLLPIHDIVQELQIDSGAIDQITATAIQKLMDIELFYASRSHDDLLGSQIAELESKVAKRPAVSVWGSDLPAAPFSLFLKRLGWYEPQQPALMIVLAQTPHDYDKCLPVLQGLDSRRKSAIPVIVVTPEGIDTVPSEWKRARPVELIELPCTYSRLVDRINRCTAGLQRERVAEVVR